jgi:TolB-like protein/DNA-binding winged helix-turn-helix (wHTH) protein/tetratricopeptide (TPR) repeat protein
MSRVDQIRPRIYRFGPFEIDLEQRLLLRAGDSVPLTPKAFDTLAVLAARPGKLVEKAELLKLVWPDTFVEENNLTQNISALRKALGEEDYIETIPRRGYRFLMDVEDVSAPAPQADPPPSPASAPSRKSRSMWIWGALSITAVVLLAIYASREFRGAGQLDHRVDSLVVLPFVNLTGSPEYEYFSDGLTEELTDALAHLEGLRVVARTTAFQFKGKPRDVRAIAEQLHVTAVLEGSVRRQEKSLRITVQLNDARSGFHIWSQTFDRGEGNIFNVQEDIANHVARTIRPDSHPLPAMGGSRDPQAYNYYLLGRFHRSRPDEASRGRAIAFFQQAIQKDPRYAAAYAGLGECYVLLAWESSVPPLEAWPRAQKAVDRALALDGNLSEAHTSQAMVNLQLDRNWEAAEWQFRRAIALNRNDAAAHHWFSHYLVAMGRFSESLAESRRALELDPLDLQISGHLIWHYLRARDYPNAIKAGAQTLELDPHSQLAFHFLAWAYEDAAQWDKAIDAWPLGSKIHPEAAILRKALQAGGPRGYWQARLAFLSQQKNPENYLLAVLHARLGESDEALARLDRAFQLHEPDLIYVKREPAFDWMESNPRFQALTGGLKLP